MKKILTNDLQTCNNEILKFVEGRCNSQIHRVQLIGLARGLLALLGDHQIWDQRKGFHQSIMKVEEKSGLAFLIASIDGCAWSHWTN